MHDQPRYKPLAASDFFERRPRPRARWSRHGRARPAARRRRALYTGKERTTSRSTTFPFPITARSCSSAASERFNIYCSPCHGRLGDGDRHGRAARLRRAAVLSHRPAARSARRPFLRRDHQRLRRHARLRCAESSRATAGPSLPTSACCSSARTRRSTTSRRGASRAGNGRQ